MRNYGIVGPTFWTRGTGRDLRGDPTTQLVALYLMSAPTANMIGLYYLPQSTIAHDTGCPIEGASKGLPRGILTVEEALRRLSEGGFCAYDQATETVFVKRMVLIRLGLENGETIGAGDKRRIGVETLLKESGSDTLAAEFWDLHHKPLRLSESCRRMPHSRGSEGAPKGHRSETETETKTTTERSGGAEVEEPKPEPPQLVLVPTEPTEKPKRDPVDLVFEAWRYRWSPKAQLDEARRKRIKARLAEGYSAEVLIEAIHNAERDPYLLGGNDRGKRYTGLETLLRDASQVDRLVALEAEPDYTPDFDWDGKPPDVEDTGPGVPPPQEFLDAFADLKRKITINAR